MSVSSLKPTLLRFANRQPAECHFISTVLYSTTAQPIGIIALDMRTFIHSPIEHVLTYGTAIRTLLFLHLVLDKPSYSMFLLFDASR